MLLALLPTLAAQPLAECPRIWTNRDVLDAVESADLAMRKLEVAGFGEARDRVLDRVACASEPLSGPTSGAVHRIVATGAFLEQAQPRIAPALAGLLAADPGYQLPLDLYPEGHPIRGLLAYAAILLRDTASRPLGIPSSGWMEVEGAPVTTVSVTRASIVQEIDGQGRVVETRYVWPEDPLGRWEPAPVVVLGLPTVLPARHPTRVPLGIATAGTAIATGVCYGLALGAHDAFYEEDSPEELVALRNRANGLTVGWIGAAAATLGLGVGLAVTW